MTSNFEVVLKDRELTSVTIAHDRTTLKIPTKISPEFREKVISFLKRIEAEVREKSDGTMRGTFNVDFTQLVLKNVSRTKTLTFNLEDEREHEDPLDAVAGQSDPKF